MVSNEFKFKAISIASENAINPNDMMDIIAFESGGSFSASKIHSKATSIQNSPTVGLIQFTESAIEGLNKRFNLNLSKESLSKMSEIEQLDIVGKYFEMNRYRGLPKSFEDLYMLIHMPKYTTSDNETIIHNGKKGMEFGKYDTNKGLDVNSDTVITKGEAAKQAKERANKSLKKEKRK